MRNIIDTDLSNEEGKKVFKKIVSLIHKDLKKYGFKKEGVNSSYRIINNVYQVFHYQKNKHNNSFTINTCIRPISWNRPESYYILSSRRVGHYETESDKWYIIDSNYIETSMIVSKIIKEKIMPVFERLNSTLQISQSKSFIKLNKIYDFDVELSSVIEENLTDISLKLLNIKILELEDINIEWAKKDLSYFLKIKELIEVDKWNDVNKILDNNKLEFYKINKKIKKE